MMLRRHRWTALLVLAFFGLAVADRAVADAAQNEATSSTPVKPFNQADVRSLTVHPTKLNLKGSHDYRQLIVTAQMADRGPHDLTGEARYDVSPPNVARLSTSGQVVPLGNGTADILVSFGTHSVRVPLAVESIGVPLPVNFANQIVPIFTKLGCNSGGCHGKANGQNGFKLSLLGFEPEVDFAALVKEARGRRVMPTAPGHSLLLLKATGMMPHGGGKRMELNSDEYQMVRRWIAAGLQTGSPDDPQLTRIAVHPEHRMLHRRDRQQLAVYAHFSDHSVEDVTRRAQYECNDIDIGTVDPSGLVQVLDASGEAAIMARFQGQVAVFRATVPQGIPLPKYTFEPLTLVDRFTHKKWEQLGIAPSELCTDEQFIRRASIDITGSLPTPAQVGAFLATKDPKKRDRLVDNLLDTAEYSYYFANKWADILKVKRGALEHRAHATFAFHSWIREAIAADKRYDEFTREILAASGDELRSPTTIWFRELPTPEQLVDDMAQVFLGQRLACANCHHHPYEKWSQDDYWGLAAFFGQLTRKDILVPGVSLTSTELRRQSLVNGVAGNVLNKRTGKPALMKPLDGEPVEVVRDEDPRHKLVDWMVDAKNPFFARAIANRYWAHFFARGIVDPPDDLRVTNPPTNPELLDALAKDLIDHQFHLKHLIRTICKSHTYQLSSQPNEFNCHDKQAFARFYPRRLSAEVLLDAICQITDSPLAMKGLPQDRFAPRRAIMLPDESFKSYFLDVFGRPLRLSACECERVTAANVAQTLHLLNSEEVQAKLSHAGGVAGRLARDPRPEPEKVAELFLSAYARKPSKRQLDLALENITLNAKQKEVAYENILWAILNTKEFLFNQ